MDKEKKLYRSTKDSKIFGVCGGIAEYSDIDSTIVRVTAVVLTFLPVIPGVLVYLILALIIPKNEAENY